MLDSNDTTATHTKYTPLLPSSQNSVIAGARGKTRLLCDASPPLAPAEEETSKKQQSLLNDNSESSSSPASKRPKLVSILADQEHAEKEGEQDDEDCWNVQYDDDDDTTKKEGSSSSSAIMRVNRRQIVPIYRDRRVLSPRLLAETAASESKSNSNNNNMVLPEEIPTLVMADTESFRLLASSQIQDNDCAVLEIGSSRGETSQQLWKVPCVTQWMGWDTGAHMVQRVQKKISNSNNQHQSRTCHKMDPLKDPDTAAALVRDTFSLQSSRLTVFVRSGLGGVAVLRQCVRPDAVRLRCARLDGYAGQMVP